MQPKNVVVPFGSGANTSDSPGVDSVFLLVILAGLRNKQLINGSLPRFKDVRPKQKNISIALEEIQRGLVSFSGHRRPEDANATSAIKGMPKNAVPFVPAALAHSGETAGGTNEVVNGNTKKS